MVRNASSQTQRIQNRTVLHERFQNLLTVTPCVEVNTTTPVYDHQGAMRFTVAVVLVYGIGVIGVLGIYVRRKPSEVLEREANIFVRGLSKYREQSEKKMQMSAVQNLVQSIHESKWKYSPSSSAASTPLMTPETRQAGLPFKPLYLDTRSPGSPSGAEGGPLLHSGIRRPALFRGFSSYTIDRQDSIPETEEEEGDEGYPSPEMVETPGSEYSSVGTARPTICLRMPPYWSSKTEPPSTNSVFVMKGDTPCSSEPTSPEHVQSGTIAKQDCLPSANKEDINEGNSDCRTNGRFTVVHVQDV